MSYFDKQSPVTDFYLEVAAGNVTGKASVNKFGENKSSAAGVTEEIWDGSVAYTYPATADMTHISQAVDQAALRGATIEVQGVASGYVLVTQDAALDATLTTNPVALTTPLLRVFRMKVKANVVGASDISLKNVGGTTTYAIISAGYNQTLMALYTVPAGKTAYVTGYYGDVLEDPVATKDPDATEYALWVADRANGYEFQIKHEHGTPKGAGGIHHMFKPYLKVTEKSDIKLTSECSGKAGHVHGGFDLILVDN